MKTTTTIIEDRIIRATVNSFLQAGLTVAVSCKALGTSPACDTDIEVMTRLRQSDGKDTLLTSRDGQEHGWLRLLYGSTGLDVFDDYSQSVSRLLIPGWEEADRCEEEFFHK